MVYLASLESILRIRGLGEVFRLKGHWGAVLQLGEYKSRKIRGGREGPNMEVLLQIKCWHYSNISLRLPVPVLLPCFSSFATVAMVARWRGNAGLGWSGGRGWERGRDNVVLVLS